MNRNSAFSNPQTFAGLAWNLGCHDANHVERCIQEWKDLFKLLQPSHVIADFGLVSGVVAQAMDFPLARIGTGFGTPPPNAGTTGMFGHEPLEAEIGLADEILGIICKSASLKLKLSCNLEWKELLAASGPTILATIADFDPYRPIRIPGEYLGVWSSAIGELPEWKEVPGIRTLAYLKSTGGLSVTCKRLSDANLNIALVCDGTIPQELRELPNLIASSQLLRIGTDCSQLQLVVGNGNHGLTLRAIELGVPQLMLPIFIEQRWNAQVAERLGVGIDLSKVRPADWSESIHQFWSRLSNNTAIHEYSSSVAMMNRNSLQRAQERLLDWLEI